MTTAPERLRPADTPDDSEEVVRRALREQRKTRRIGTKTRDLTNFSEPIKLGQAVIGRHSASRQELTDAQGKALTLVTLAWESIRKVDDRTRTRTVQIDVVWDESDSSDVVPHVFASELVQFDDYEPTATELFDSTKTRGQNAYSAARVLDHVNQILGSKPD